MEHTKQGESDLQNNDVQDQMNNLDISNQKRSRRYQKCVECDEYYEIIDNKSDHNCIRALRDRVTSQQEQISNMVTKEQVAEILKGYVPQDAFLNFIRATEKKFSELFLNMNNHEEMLKQFKKEVVLKCPAGHVLYQLTGIRLHTVTCDLCAKKALDRGKYTQRCETCNFDICAACETLILQTKCKRGHNLNPINPQEYDQIQCNNCLKIISNTEEYSYRCKQCDYDLCQKCLSNNSSTSNKEKKGLFF